MSAGGATEHPPETDLPSRPAASAPALPEHLRSARVLVVDDQPANLRFFQRLLSRAGYREVHTATDGTMALQVFDRVRPDLIVLDLLMPGLDGFGVMEALRARQGMNPVPVLVLSGDERTEVRRRALSCGARDFLALQLGSVVR